MVQNPCHLPMFGAEKHLCQLIFQQRWNMHYTPLSCFVAWCVWSDSTIKNTNDNDANDCDAKKIK